MGNKKWNFAVVKSIFGDLWVGKTTRKPEKERIFTDIKEAIYKAEILFENRHINFDPDIDDEDYDYDFELAETYNELIETTEESAEEISKGLEKFIVK